jgi:hypothetical protein
LLSLGSLTLRTASCGVVRTLKKPKRLMWQRTVTSCQQSALTHQAPEWVVLQTVPPGLSDLWSTAALEDILTVTPWETLNQSHLVKLLLTSWPTEKSKKINVYCVKLLSFSLFLFFLT